MLLQTKSQYIEVTQHILGQIHDPLLRTLVTPQDNKVLVGLKFNTSHLVKRLQDFYFLNRLILNVEQSRLFVCLSDMI